MVEDLGTQVLVLSRPFRLEVPVLDRASLGPRAAIACPTLSLGGATRAALAVGYGHDPGAAEKLRIQARASDDGLFWRPIEGSGPAGGRAPAGAIHTNLHFGNPRFLKVVVENTDALRSVSVPEIVLVIEG
jgi:hypothetical protein